MAQMLENEKNLVIKDKATVKIGNKLVKANCKFELLQSRMNNAFLSLIDRENAAFNECTVSVDRLAELMNLPDDGHRLQVIRRIVTTIGNCSFSWSAIDEPDGDCGSIPWFSFVKYSKKEKTVSWQYNSALGSELLFLRKDYTPEKLLKLQRFKYSCYSDTFMKLILMDVANPSPDEKKPYYPIDILRDRLCLGNKYPKYGNFRARILEPVTKDINEFSDYKLNIVPVKDGKKVVGVILDYSAKIKSPFELYPWRQEIKNKLLSCGVDVYKATAIAKSEKYSKAYFAANIKAWENAKNLQNPAAALVSFVVKNKAGYQAPAAPNNLEKAEKNLKTDILNEFLGMSGAAKKALLDNVTTELTTSAPEDVYNIYKPLLLIDDLEGIGDFEKELLVGYVFRMRYPDYPAHDPVRKLSEEDTVKEEFLGLERQEQENYLDIAKKGIAENPSAFYREANGDILKSDLTGILNDNDKLMKLIRYIIKLRHTELKVE